nr:C80 family cysteine peptidase [uncultured Moellerella sp.]
MNNTTALIIGNDINNVNFETEFMLNPSSTIENMNAKSSDDFIYIINRYIKNKTKVILSVDKEMIYDSFNDDNKLLKIIFNNKGKKDIIYTNVLDVFKLEFILSEDKIFVRNDGSEIFFLDKGMYGFYIVDDESKVKFVSDDNINTLFGEPRYNIDTSINDMYQQYLQEESLYLAGDNDSDNRSNKKIEDWWDPSHTEPKIITSKTAAEKEKNSIPTYEHNLVIQLEDSQAITNIASRLVSKHPDNTTLIQFNIKDMEYRRVYGDIDLNLIKNIRWTIVGHGNYFKDEKMTTFAENTPDELINGLKYLKSDLKLQKNPDKIVLLGCHLSKGSANNNFALNVAKAFYQEGIDIPIVAYSKFIGVNPDGNKFIYFSEGSNQISTTRNFKQVYQFDKKTKKLQVNNIPEIIYLMQNYPNIYNRLDNFIEKNRISLDFYFTKPDGSLDFDLIKKSILSYAGSSVFVNTVISFHNDDFSTFHATLSKNMIDKGVIETPIWEHVNYQDIIRSAKSKQSTDKEQIHIILRLSNKKHIRDSVINYAKEDIQNTFIIQLDLETNKTHIEYGDMQKLQQIANQRWTILDTIDLENANDAKFINDLARNIDVLCKTYKFNKGSPAEVINIPEPINITVLSEIDNGQNSGLSQVNTSEPSSSTQTIPRDSVIRHGSEVVRRQISYDDPLIDDIIQLNTQVVRPSATYTSSESTQSINHWWDNARIIALPPSLYPRVNNEPSLNLTYNQNVIIQLDGDNTINESAINLLRKNHKNSTLIQFNIKTKEYRLVYGLINPDVVGSIRWITIGYGKYLGENKMTCYADSTPQEFVDGLIYLKSKLNIQKDPDKLVLVGSELSKGNSVENFALNTTKYLSSYDINIPIVAYNQKIGIDKDGKKIIIRDQENKIYHPTNEYKMIYQMNKSTNSLLINGLPALFRMMIDFPDISNNFDYFIEQYKEYLKIYFTRPDGLLDHNLIKKSISSSEGAKIFGDLAIEFIGKDHSNFYQILAQKLIDQGIVEVPIWDYIDYSFFPNRLGEKSTSSTESLNIILRLNNKNHIRNKVFKLVEENSENSVVVQLDINTNKEHIEYGNLKDLTTSNNLRWIVVDDTNHSSISPLQYFNTISENVQRITETYSLNKVNKLEFFHLVDPTAMINSNGNSVLTSQQLQPYSTGNFTIPLNEASDLNRTSGIDQTIHDDYQEYLSELEKPVNEIDNGLRKPLEEWKIITFNDSQHQGVFESNMQNVIIQLENDPKARIAIKRLVNKHPNNTTVIQYNISTNQYRVIYGNINPNLSGKVRWISIGNGNYHPSESTEQNKVKSCLSTYAGYTPEQFVEGLLSLKKQLCISKNPDKLVLIGCDLARGGIKNNFAFNITNLLSKLEIGIPIVAYASKVSINSKGNKAFNIYDELLPHIRGKDFRRIYQYSTDDKWITVNNKPLILDIIKQYQEINLSFEEFIRDHIFYLEPFFSQDDGQIDTQLIKKVALDQQNYQVFDDLLKNIDSDKFEPAKFHKHLVEKIAENNSAFNQGPIWQKVDHQHINVLSSVSEKDSTTSDDFNIVIRFNDSESSRQQATYIAANNPKNTIVIQFDMESGKNYVEYGEQLLSTSTVNKNWFALTSIGSTLVSSPQYTELLSNSISRLQQIYQLKIPEKINLIDLNKNNRVDSYKKYKNFLTLLSLKLASKNINADIYFQDAIIPKIKSLGYYDFDNKFTYDVESKAAYINGEHYMKYILSELMLNDVDVSKLGNIKHPFFTDFYTQSNGLFDYDKLATTIYDPLISRQVNSYFTEGGFLQHNALEIWGNIFKLPLTENIKQKALDSIYLLDALSENPSRIKRLGQYSIKLLNELFPSKKSTIFPEVLSLLNQPGNMLFIESQLNKIIGLDSLAEFEGLPLGEVLRKQNKENIKSLKSYNDILKIYSNNNVNADLVKVESNLTGTHGTSTDKNINFILGRLYAFFQQQDSFFFEPNQLSDILNYVMILNNKKSKNLLSPRESDFLSKFHSLSSDLMEKQQSGLLNKNDRILSNQSLSHWLTKVNPGSYQIETLTGVLTFVVKNDKNNHQYSLYDSHGWAITYSHSDRNIAKNDFLKNVMAYLNCTVSDENGPILTRGKEYGFLVDSNDYRVNIRTLSNDKQLRAHLFSSLSRLSVPNRISSIIFMDKTYISIETLNRLGATIDGIPLDAIHSWELDTYKRLKFDAKKLTTRLTCVDGNKSDIQLIFMLKQLMQHHGNISNIVETNSDLAEHSVLLKQLNHIHRYTNNEKHKIDFSLWGKLQQTGVKLPRYMKAMNRTGQAMTLYGAISLFTSTYYMLEQLDHPLLSPADRKEIHKNLGFAWSSGFFNLTDLAQPWLLKLAYRQAKSTHVATTSVGKLSMGLSAIGSGIDLAVSFDTFIQLLNEKDPKRRQDLMVNFVMSLAGAGVGLFTLIGIAAGLTAAGPAGLIAGGLLLIAGFAYNGVRAVKHMKSIITFDSLADEIHEGFRAGFGLPPTTKTRNKLHDSYIRQGAIKNSWLNNLHFYSSVIQPLGFDSHLFVDEEWETKELPLYRLQVKGKSDSSAAQLIRVTNYVIGGTNEIPSYIGDNREVTTKNNATLFTAEEIAILNKSGRWEEVLAEEKQYIPVTSKSSDETFIFDNSYNNDLLESHFVVQKRTKDKAMLSSSALQKIRLYSLNSVGIDQRKKGMSLLSNSFYDINNKDHKELFEQYLQRQEGVSGLSINTGTGNDVVIGAPDECYSFKVFNGNKLFVAGNKNDYFYYMANDKSLEKNNNFFDGKLKIAPVIKYLDAREGNDTLIIGTKVERYRTKISLKDKEISYLTKKQSFSAAVIDNFENIIGHAQQGEILEGNDNNNILDGAGGKDKIYGQGGNDKIILSQGYANGGIDDDYYVVKRYVWSLHTKDIVIDKQVYSEEQGKVINRKIINKDFKFNRGYGANSRVEIDEKTASISNVELEYDFKEISEVKLVENDLHIIIDIKPHELDKDNLSLDYILKSKAHLILKNVYRDDNKKNNKVSLHKYNIRTQDGFLLNSILPDILSEKKSVGNIFNIQYVKDLDRSIHNPNDITIDIDCNAKDRTMIIYFINRDEYISPTWGEFIWRGTDGKFKFTGDEKNNTLLLINNMSYIFASHGEDYYSFTELKNSNVNDSENIITFDFSKLSDENVKTEENGVFTSKDKMLLVFEHHLGDDLIMRNNSISFKNEESNKMEIKFINFNKNINPTIYIQDKAKKLFAVELNQHGGTIDPIVENLSYSTGDNIIFDASEKDKIIKGNKENNTIIALKGVNILCGGQGNDQVYGGSYNDLLIANGGNDELLGREGNDQYLIDGETIGDVIIEDINGHNNLYLMNFSMDYKVEKQTDNNISHIYQADNGKTLTIRNANQIDENNGICLRVHDVSEVKKQLANQFNIESNQVVDKLIQNMTMNEKTYNQTISALASKSLKSPWSPAIYLDNSNHLAAG